MRSMFVTVLLAVNLLSACAPKTWECHDPQVTSTLAQLMVNQVDAAPGMLSTREPDSADAFKNVVGEARAFLEGIKAAKLTLVHDTKFEKEIGLRMCNGKVEVPLPPAVKRTFDRIVESERPRFLNSLIYGSAKIDPAATTIVADLDFSTQPSSDTKELLVGIKSGDATLTVVKALAQAQTVEAQFKVADAARATAAAAESAANTAGAESTARKSAEALLGDPTARFLASCRDQQANNARKLGGMGKAEAEQLALKTCDSHVAEKFSACTRAGGQYEVCERDASPPTGE